MSSNKPKGPPRGQKRKRKAKVETVVEVPVAVVEPEVTPVEPRTVPATPKPAAVDLDRAREIIFEPNPGPQTDFLASTEQEVQYGGAAGGGKSYAMVADPVRYFNNENARGLLVRRSTEELRELISVSKQLYPRAVPGIRWLERDKTWVAPSGATLWMSYLDRDDDVLRYQGQAFCVSEGTEVLTDEGKTAVEDVKVGTKVKTLSGFKEVTYKASKQTKKCVKVSVYSLDGHLLSTQIHPDSHPIALLSSKPYLLPDGLSHNTEQFQKSPLLWLSQEQLQSEYSGTQETVSSQEDDQSYYKESEGDNLKAQQPLGSSYLSVRLSLDSQSDLDRASTQYRTSCKCHIQSEGSSLTTSKKQKGLQQPYEYAQSSKDRNTCCSRSSLPYGGETCAQLESQTALDYSDRCSAYCCQCGEPLPVSQEDGLGYALLQDDAEGQDLYSRHEDGKGCTPLRTRYLGKTYNHPYTGEQLPLEVPLELCIVHVEPLDDPLRVVYDLTIKDVNNYITSGGIVNKNCWIGFDELTQWPTPTPWNYMRSRLRTTSASGLPLYMRSTTNPGGPGHHWVKKMFIDPAPANTPFWATDDQGEVLKFPKGHSRDGQPLFKRRFIPATLFDNPYLADDGMYEANLLALPEHQRRQLLEGDWSIAEGAAFSEFNPKMHVIEPFEIPRSWSKFRACDYGYGSMTAVLWLAVSPDEQIVVYRELYVSKVTASDLADMILEAESGDNIKYGVLDSSLWHNRGDTGPSLAEQMIAKGCRWRPSDRSKGSRIAGKNELHRRLQVDDFTQKPRLVFFNTCRNIVNELPALPLDKYNPEDVDTKSPIDHGYDALRYGLMTRPRSSIWDYNPTANNRGFQMSDSTFGY